MAQVEIKVPQMGESISEATIGEILKASGEHVQADEEILELETDKVNQVLYAPEAGLLTLSVSVDDTVKVGQVIGSVDSDQKAATQEATAKSEEPKAEPKKKSEVKEEPPAAPPEPQPAPAKGGGSRRTKETFAAEVKSGGVQKSLTAAAPAAAQPTPRPAGSRGESRKRMSKIRRVIADRLVEAQQTTAMLTTFNEVDLSQVMALRAKYKESFEKKYGVRLGFMSFFTKAVVAALKLQPGLNSYIDGDEIVERHYYDIGMAVSTPRGLVVPVIRECDLLSFSEIELAIHNFALKAREGKISVDDLQGGGFTITNGGVFGSLLSTPILNPPQSGILGMHKIEKRPVVVDNEIVIRPMMYLAMSYDHRIVDGREAVTFLVQVKEQLEDPSRLLLEI